MQQTTIRALTKLEFAYGLATRLAEAVNDTSPPTLEMLGELHGYVEVTRSALLLAEEHAYDRGEGVWFPDGRPLHPMRAILATWFPRVNDILITIGSHNLLATPSRAMLDDGRLRPLLDEFLHGAADVGAEERAALYRLAWDFVGSNLGGRNDLYERNYLASARTNRTIAHLVYADRTRPVALVDAMLASPAAMSLRGPPSPAELLDVAVAAARAGGAVLVEGLERPKQVELKSERMSIVTWADLAAQAEVVDASSASATPTTPILGRRGPRRGGRTGRAPGWSIPLDGTSNYAHNIPFACTSVAVRDADGLAAGSHLRAVPR